LQLLTSGSLMLMQLNRWCAYRHCQPAGKPLEPDGTAVTAGQRSAPLTLQGAGVPALNGNGLNYANFTFSVQDSAGSFDAAQQRDVQRPPVNATAPVAVNDVVASTNEDAAAVIAQKLAAGQ
jgi:hypothetical protein